MKPISLVWVIALIGMNSFGWADEPLAPLHTRFQPSSNGRASTAEIPDFQRHISPLLGRLGCNGRACHGSFQGQGGFMLSLFGYDFDVDHKALLDESRGRVNTKSPLESLVLTKPTDESMHEGGKRFEKDGWEYQVLRAWIEAGAPKKSKATSKGSEQRLLKLEVAPMELALHAPGSKASVTAIAIWNDGTREDVTSLCRFFSNDASIAAIDERGDVTAGNTGDTQIVVSYDNAVVPVYVLRPAGPTGMLSQEIAHAKSEVDRLVLKKLDKLGIQPSPISDDAEFYRRVSLDITGTLPTVDQVRRFLDDRSPNKRSEAVESLLASPGYAAYWTTFLCDITGNNDDQLRNFTYLKDAPNQHWYQWIYARVANNTPYDKIVEGIVTAVSREPGESYLDYCDAMTKIANDKTGKAYADRSDMMYYWARNNLRTSEDRAISFAYAFCGVRIQCAQCHKHPFDQWTKRDFEQFERFFDGINANQNSLTAEGKKSQESILTSLGFSKSIKGNELSKKVQEKFKDKKYDQTLPFPEVFVQTKNEKKVDKKNEKDKKTQTNTKPQVTARLLGGEQMDLSGVQDPRKLLMTWLRRSDNPYFAKAIVNRVWAHYFEIGIVNPSDDLNLANAPSNAELLDYLSNGFIQSGYDLKWLHRTIVNTNTYQRSWAPNASNEMDRRNFSHALLRRLPAETAYDALRVALSSDRHAASISNLETDRAMTLAGASAQMRNRKGDQYALSVFGRSIRESNCDCDRTSDPSLLQTVFIRNDADIIRAMNDNKTSWLAQIATENGWKMNGDDSKPNDSKSKAKAKASEMASMDADADQKVADELERRVRSLRAQIEKFKNREDSKDKLRDLKSRLALNEKRFAAQMELLAKKAESDDHVSDSKTADSHAATTAANATASEKWKGLIETAYLRTLSRFPDESELARTQQSISQANTPIQGLGDLLWVLINSKEFILNH